MGAGKSTIGRLLAKRLDLDFFDSDQMIEERCGADIGWIFDVEGEAGFRKRESAMLAELVNLSNAVIATGGGAVVAESNRALLAQGGEVIYLKSSPEQQFERTRRDPNRPLLQSDDPLGVLRRLFVERDPLYREVADRVVDTEGRAPRSVAQDLARQFSPSDPDGG